jgi:hypothetical protein
MSTPVRVKQPKVVYKTPEFLVVSKNVSSLPKQPSLKLFDVYKHDNGVFDLEKDYLVRHAYLETAIEKVKLLEEDASKGNVRKAM